jgi:AcrR family transcriptional regulator
MPKEVDHDARREELILAAWRVIAEHGIDETTIREIAKESGYSSGVLAHYFENKDDLLAHALVLSHTRIRGRYADDIRGPVAIKGLKALIRDNLPLDEQRDLEMRIEMSFWARSLGNEALHKIQDEESEVFRSMLGDLVDRAQEEGSISPDHDRDMVLQLLGSMIDGTSLHALLYPDRMPPRRQTAVMEFALELLR